MALGLPQAILGTTGYFSAIRKDDFLDKITGEYIARINLPAGISPARRSRFIAEVQRIDRLIDLDFLIDSMDGTTAGATINIEQKRDPADFRGSPGYSTDYGEIFLNLDELTTDRKYGNTLLHELGHAIGLNHPWEDGGPGGEANTIDDPNRFTDEETIMAYRSKQDDDERFRDADIQALQILWGSENGGRPVPDYKFEALAGRIDEGLNLNIKITATNVPIGARLYWSYSGAGIQSADFVLSAEAVDQSVQLQPDGTALLAIAIKRDFAREGDETLGLTFFADSALNQQIGEIRDVVIRDTSNMVPSSNYLLSKYNTVTSDKTYSAPITNYRFARLPEGLIGVKGPGAGGGVESRFDRLASDELTIRFADKVQFTYKELESVFDQVKGFDDISGKVFRLYNAAFKRIPDAAGFQYWNEINANQKATLAQTAFFFTQAPEFIARYGANASTRTFVTGLYNNILGRDPDASGLAFWDSALSSGRLDRAGVLMEFSQSAENKLLFSEATGLA